MDIAEYADAHGWKPRPRVTVVEWYEQNPEAAEQVHKGLAIGLTHKQIHAFLVENFGCPFKEPNKTVRVAPRAS